ncbi:endonuclease MutS2 [Nitrospina watsonii]|uniref:Endonuclease MutS2 n=1 Tax=Nitrospina watsonii TaxID=1323948 RepID=A0ABM9HBX6_9BACT|nr:endonuclease MutS2 [Nitrospina watsonii]CAI2717721.1 Endonuclease MutS2 [Nitrospina watsonii]
MNPQDSTSDITLNQSMALLGWEWIQRALAEQAMSALTRSQLIAQTPTSDIETAQRWLAETTEMVALFHTVEALPLRTFSDLTPALVSMRERLLVEAEDCLQVAAMLRLVRDLKRYLGKQESIPHLAPYAAQLEPVPELIREIERCIDDDGEIKDDASPELKQAVRDAARARDNLESTLNKLMASSTYKDALQDSYFTERDGRLVVPVRTDLRSRIEGIVHDTSGSGQTVFMEPTQVVTLNNQVKLARLTVQRERIRILETLALQIKEHENTLRLNQHQLVALDGIHARARLARRMDAHPYTLHEDGPLTLNQARNPELILNDTAVVANDIAWSPEKRIIIISGPNTGGKTVTLKTVGVMALMARCGLFLPVAPRSAMRFFPEVYADIGDEQNIELSLSTFSGHIKKIIHILDRAASGALILLDELGIATDPQEGAALAEAILLEMKARNFTTLVSTHFLALKTLAQTQEGFLNACMEFDIDKLSPTYRLVFGVPGDSAALETAQRLGLPRETIDRARRIYAEKDRRAEQLLQELNRQKLDLENEKAGVSRDRETTEALKREQQQLTDTLRAQEKEYAKTKAKRIQNYVRDAKRELRTLIEGVRQSRDLPTLRKAEKQVRHIGHTPLAESGPDRNGWDVPPDRLREGDEILVEDYNACGVLLENPEKKDRVRVRLGNLTTVVETKRLRGHVRRSPSAKPQASAPIKIETESQSHPRTTLDLRGMRVEEATEALELFLSQAVVNKLAKVTIVHGHGMGKIKQAVRDYLASSGIGKEFAPGERHEGGDGATIVTF